MSEITRKDFLGLGTVAAAGLASGCAPAANVGGLAPDMVVVNGNVLTQDDARPIAGAFAIKDGRFVAVGATDDVQNLAAAGTEIVDAAGATVVPGFIDAHSHPSGAGLNALKNVDTNLGSIARIQEALRARAAETPAGEWIVGYMYDDTKQEEGRPVNRLDLDTVSTEHPIVVGHRGGHTGVYNSMAFATAGVTVDTQDPFGGHFYREDGELTGKVAESARGVFNVSSPSTREERAEAVWHHLSSDERPRTDIRASGWDELDGFHGVPGCARGG